MRGRVGHMEPSPVLVKKKAVTVAKYIGSAPPGEGLVFAIEVKLADDVGLHGGVREEGRVIEIIILQEDAAHRAWKQLCEQKPARIDDGAPRLAHASRGGEAARREAAEDFTEGVLGQREARQIPFHQVRNLSIGRAKMRKPPSVSAETRLPGSPRVSPDSGPV